MAVLDDAASIKRLKAIFQEHLDRHDADIGLTPYTEDGISAAPNQLYTTPTPGPVGPPAQAYADGGEVSAYTRFTEDGDRTADAWARYAPKGEYQRYDYMPRFSDPTDLARGVVDAAKGIGRDFADSGYNPARYLIHGADRFAQNYLSGITPQDVADMAVPHDLGDQYGLSGRVADALSTVMPGVGSLAIPPLYEGARYVADKYLPKFGEGGRVDKVIKTIRNAYGRYQGNRAAEAADLTNLDRISTSGLLDIFNPKNTGLLAALPPSRFEEFANPINPDVAKMAPYPRWTNVPGGGRVKTDQRTLDNYLSRLSGNLQEKGAYDAPTLWLGRTIDDLTNVAEHEGRHRMRAMDRLGDKASLVRLQPGNPGFLGKDADDNTTRMFEKYFPLEDREPIQPQYNGGPDRPLVPLGVQPFKEGGNVLRKLAKAFTEQAEKVRGPDSGFSWHPQTGEPSGGYIGSMWPERGQVIPPAQLSGPSLQKFYRKNRDLLDLPDHYLGAWHDPESGQIYVDVSKHGGDLNDIAMQARAANQKSIFDLGNFETIDTGGTGTPLRAPPTYGPGFADGGVVAGGPIKWLSNLVAEKLGPAGEAAAAKVRSHAEKTGREASAWGATNFDPENVRFVKGRQAETSIKGEDAAHVWGLKASGEPFFIAHPHPVISNMPISSHLNNRNIDAKTGAKFMGETGTPGMIYPSPADLNVLGLLGPKFSSLIEGAGSPDARVLLQHGDQPEISKAMRWVGQNRPGRESRDLMLQANRQFGMNDADPSGYAVMMNDALANRFGLDVSMDPAGTASGRVPLQDLLKEYPKALGYPSADDFLRRPGFREGGVVNKLARKFLVDPVRERFPGIYQDPDKLVEQAKKRFVPDEGKEGSMYRLFGHTRDSLDDLSQGSRDLDSITPFLKRPPFNLSGNADNSAQVLTNRNANRLVDTIGAGLEDPAIRATRSWYEMSPMYDRMRELGTGDKAMRDLNTRMSVMSAGSDPQTEINRGFYANWLAGQGRLEDFVRHGATPDHERGSDFPSDMMGLRGHAYHHTSQVPNLLDYENTGQLWPAQHKVPTYTAATDPQFPFSDRPVADSHFSRILGYPDVSTAATDAVRKGTMSGTQYSDMVPWFRDKVAGKLDMRPRDAQALLWNLGGPQTGVRYIGPSKLEMISNYMDQTAKELGISPDLARDKLLTGEIGGASSHAAPFKRGGSVESFFNEFQAMNYRRGGPARDPDDVLNYHPLFFRHGGKYKAP